MENPVSMGSGAIPGTWYLGYALIHRLRAARDPLGGGLGRAPGNPLEPHPEEVSVSTYVDLSQQ